MLVDCSCLLLNCDVVMSTTIGCLLQELNSFPEGNQWLLKFFLNVLTLLVKKEN